MATLHKKGSQSSSQQYGRKILDSLKRDLSNVECRPSVKRKSPARPLLPCDARPDLCQIEFHDLGVVLELPDTKNRDALLRALICQLHKLVEEMRHE